MADLATEILEAAVWAARRRSMDADDLDGQVRAALIAGLEKAIQHPDIDSDYYAPQGIWQLISALTEEEDDLATN